MDKKVYDLEFRKRKVQFVFGGRAKLLLIPFFATLFNPIPFLNLVFVAVLGAAILIAQFILRSVGRRGFYSKDAEYIRITLDANVFAKTKEEEAEKR